MNKEVKDNTGEPLYRAVISGTGSSVPPDTITNDDLSKMVDTSDEWITTRTGIKTRHIASKNETTAELATEAAKKAIEMAGLNPEEIDAIIVVTITPEMVFPSTACFVQKELGAKNAWATDLSAACSGFVYSVSIAQQFIESGRYKNILAIGAETLSKITNWEDRASCILFGDGAGAVVLQRSEEKDRGVLYSTMGSDGSLWYTLNCQAYGSKNPVSKPLDDPNKVYMEIQGRQIYQLAVRKIVETVEECLEKHDLTIEHLDMLIPHQMNARIIESAAKRLGIKEKCVFKNIAEYGNTSAASVPIAFDEYYRLGKGKKGDTIILVSFGAGLTWGANLMRL
jgi:3-oxoacyl-[acyl-carrier-protein] synthase-3